MKKYLFIILVFGAVKCVAQPHKTGTWNVSAGMEGLFPLSDLANTHKTGFGAAVKGEYLFAKHASVTAGSGYYYLPAKNNGINQRFNINAVPVKAGLRYYLGNFYAGAEAGVLRQFNHNPSTSFLYAFSVGDEIIVKRNSSVDIGLRYERWNTAVPVSIFAVRLSYEFELW